MNHSRLIAKIKERNAKAWFKAIACTIIYIVFLYWVKSWWGIIVIPFIIDAYVTKIIKWGWWKQLKNNFLRNIMAWVDALVFALVAVYFLNQFFFQNFVIPSSSLEKTLLTGDYLLVSKLAYGPRIPQTPLSFPLMQHTVPGLGCKSYLEHPHWPYRRVKGTGHVKLNDIVVFNYPSGDTVAVNVQDQDYYRLVYQIGTQLTLQPNGTTLLSTIPSDSSYVEHLKVFNTLYNTGSNYIHHHPEIFGKVVARPVDRRENYVKRCVGMPGDKFEIRNDTIYLNDKAQPQPEHAQWNYAVSFRSIPTTDELKALGISKEDLSMPLNEPYTYLMPLTNKVKAYFLKDTLRIASLKRFHMEDEWLYPQNMRKDWSVNNYGPLLIPHRGQTINLTLSNLPIYERPIRIYEGNKLQVSDGKIYINDKPATSYTFRYNYYWMMGDNRDNSADSRFWGFVPETHIVGQPLFIWMSLDKDYGWLDGKIRWNRFFKGVTKA